MASGAPVGVVYSMAVVTLLIRFILGNRCTGILLSLDITHIILFWCCVSTLKAAHGIQVDPIWPLSLHVVGHRVSKLKSTLYDKAVSKWL